MRIIRVSNFYTILTPLCNTSYWNCKSVPSSVFPCKFYQFQAQHNLRMPYDKQRFLSLWQHNCWTRLQLSSLGSFCVFGKKRSVVRKKQQIDADLGHCRVDLDHTRNATILQCLYIRVTSMNGLFLVIRNVHVIQKDMPDIPLTRNQILVRTWRPVCPSCGKTKRSPFFSLLVQILSICFVIGVHRVLSAKWN